jgi:hypothetical protein
MEQYTEMAELSDITRRNLLAAAGATGVASLLPTNLSAQANMPAPTLIRGAVIFDGQSEELITGMDVLVEDGMISVIAADITAPDGAVNVDADGGTDS